MSEACADGESQDFSSAAPPPAKGLHSGTFVLRELVSIDCTLRTASRTGGGCVPRCLRREDTEQQLADIKDKRSANKQAITELAAQKTKASDKVYVFSGGAKGLFIKLPYKDVHGLVTKDQRALKEEAAQVRKGLDADRQTLRDDGFII